MVVLVFIGFLKICKYIIYTLRVGGYRHPQIPHMNSVGVNTFVSLSNGGNIRSNEGGL
jgi:hypothetical protein